MKRAIVLVLDSFGIGNAPDAAAFGMPVLGALGEAHIASHKPVVYTSTDSVFQIVFQIAAHETHFGLTAMDHRCSLSTPTAQGDR